MEVSMKTSIEATVAAMQPELDACFDRLRDRVVETIIAVLKAECKTNAGNAVLLERFNAMYANEPFKQRALGTPYFAGSEFAPNVHTPHHIDAECAERHSIVLDPEWVIYRVRAVLEDDRTGGAELDRARMDMDEFIGFTVYSTYLPGPIEVVATDMQRNRKTVKCTQETFDKYLAPHADMLIDAGLLKVRMPLSLKRAREVATTQ
jgi:hypothetical protein